MEPFLKWAGGKRWLIPKLLNKLPRFVNYYEPFLGSGGLFFALEPQKAVLSDTNQELINCYRCVRDNCREVIQVLRKVPKTKEMYYRVRDRLYERADDVKKAAYFIYLNKTCWNGLYRVNREGRFNVPPGRIAEAIKIFDADHLFSASILLKRAKIQCCDFEKAVKTSKSGDLIYFDPPYITTHLNNGFIKYNSKLFHHSDELRLASVAKFYAVRRASVVVSNAAHPLIRQQYDGPFYKVHIERNSRIAADSSCRGRFTELLITSFPLDLV